MNKFFCSKNFYSLVKKFDHAIKYGQQDIKVQQYKALHRKKVVITTQEESDDAL